MSKIVVARIGVEGGGEDLFGRRDGDAWSFWKEGSSWGLDDDGEEVVTKWATEPVSDLAALLPEHWPMYYPLAIHPEFLDWFRDRYEASRAALPPEIAGFAPTRWAAILGGRTDDRLAPLEDPDP